MNKLSLDLRKLSVQSFSLHAGAADAAGTVHAHASYPNTACCPPPHTAGNCPLETNPSPTCRSLC